MPLNGLFYFACQKFCSLLVIFLQFACQATVKQGDSGVNDFIRNDLQRYHPKIRIEDTPQFYDLSVFNRCAETGKVLLTIECWQEVHPGLVSIPVNWDYSIPYGLLYSFDAPKDVLRFVERVKALRNE